MAGDPETLWLFGSGTPPWPSSRDWTANTVWLSMPEDQGEDTVYNRKYRSVKYRCVSLGSDHILYQCVDPLSYTGKEIMIVQNNNKMKKKKNDNDKLV